MLSDVVSLSFIRLDKLYDSLVIGGNACMNSEYDSSTNSFICVQVNPLKKIKFLIIVPIYFIYFIFKKF